MRLLEEKIVGIRPVGPPDLVDIGKAFRGDQRRLCSLPLDHRVDGDRRAVNEMEHLLHVHAPLRQDLMHAVGKAWRRAEHLLKGHGIGRLVVPGEVGERAADIDGDALRFVAELLHDERALQRSLLTRFSMTPTPSTSQRTTSPSCRNFCGFMKKATPAGDPVAMTSPGIKVMAWLQ